MSLSKNQLLILFALLGKGGGAFQKDVKPGIKKADRDALKRAGLIEAEKRGGKGFEITVSDKGWDFAAAYLGADLPERTTAGALILQAWLARLKIFLDAKGLNLADFIAPTPAPVETKSPAPPPEPADLRARIRAAYLEATGGKLNTRALLRDIRPRLLDVDREAVDAALVAMHRAEEAALYPRDDRRSLTDADRDAALSIAGEPRHILWIDK